MPPGTIASTITVAARLYGDLAALRTSSGESMSYADLDLASDEAAAGLARRGLVEGSVLLLSLPSGLEYAVAYLAAAKLGAVTAGANPRLTPRERRCVVEAMVPDLVVADPGLLDGVPDGVDVEIVDEPDGQTTRGPPAVLGGLRSRGGTPIALPDDPDRPVCICFTSGSTGDPKGAWFTNRQLAAIARIDTGGAWGGGGHVIASTAFGHVGSMTKLMWQLAGGSTIHLVDRWYAGEVLELTERYRMPAVAGVAAQVALLLRHPDFDEHDFSCVQAIVVGGAASPPALVQEARERFGAPYSIRYSSTESGGVGLATALDADDEEALHTVGRPRPGVDADVRDTDGLPLERGAIGELWLRTPTAMSGYWRDPDGTAAALVDGWLRTGDLARVDDRGCFRLTGRLTEMFIRGGHNVYPLEVEAVLGTHPAVAQVAVVPRPDDVMGEIGVAVVVPSDPSNPPTLEDLMAHGRSDLASYKLPEALRIVDSLPLNSGDKLDRRRMTADMRGD